MLSLVVILMLEIGRLLLLTMRSHIIFNKLPMDSSFYCELISYGPFSQKIPNEATSARVGTICGNRIHLKTFNAK